MSHLEENHTSYFQHLRRAWFISLICFVHGVFPNVWQTKASQLLCGNRGQQERDTSLDDIG